MDSINNIYQKKIQVISQGQIENSDNPCTGISYFVLQNIKLLIKFFKLNDDKEYNLLYKSLIERAVVRKNTNSKIPKEGEFLDEETIKEDFKEIFNKINIKYYFDNNELFNSIKNLDNNYAGIVTRGSATFVFVKFNSDEFLIIDSHNSYHGTMSLKNFIKYINFDNLIECDVEIGFFKI